ncbi:MAG: hypothetical protein M5U34_08750 [Chloroflexi bacterium]|nr:hypothetical protein [Chloroflexota bacterium]
MVQKSHHKKTYWGIFIFSLVLILLSLGVYFSQCCQKTAVSPDNALIAISATCHGNAAATQQHSLATKTGQPLSPPALATPTLKPSSTPLPTATLAPTLQPTPQAIFVNGLPPEAFIQIPAKTMHHSLEILARGKAAGRNPNRFSKVEDSILDTIPDHIKGNTFGTSDFATTRTQEQSRF